MFEKIYNIIDKEINALRGIPIDTHLYSSVIDLIYKRVHQLGGKLVISGMGKAGQIALNMATTFSSTGTPAIFLHPGEAQHGDLGIMQDNDILILISNSGKTKEIVELVELNKHFRHLPVIIITSFFHSPLFPQSELIILTGNPKEVCPLGLTPTTSTTVMTVIGDILVVLMMERIGFTREEYYKRHHGGYLGQKIKEEL